MNAFYFAAAILAAIALTMLLRPLRAKSQVNNISGHNALLETNSAIYRTQLAELKRDHEVGQLSDADYAQAYDELQRRLLDDAQASSQPDAAHSAPPNHTRRTRIALAFFLPLCALGIYSQIGNPVAALSPAEQSQRAEQSMENMIVSLRAKLDAKPDNPEGWAMLAQSYGALGRWDDAAQAFTHIGPKLTQDPRLLAAFAEVLARQAGGNFEGKPRTLIALALKLDPRHPYALMLAGSDAFQDRRWPDVIANWEPLLAQLDPTSEDAQSLEQGLAKAREMGAVRTPAAGADTFPPPSRERDRGRGGSAVSTVGAGDTPSNTKTSVSGRVGLAAELKDKALPDDTVYIFARAVDDDNAPASRMPLAVRRAQVKDLPLNFVLDDSMAMTPQSKISGAKQLRVEARISRSGNAVAATGDIAGQSKTIKPGASNLIISLDHVVP